MKRKPNMDDPSQLKKLSELFENKSFVKASNKEDFFFFADKKETFSRNETENLLENDGSEEKLQTVSKVKSFIENNDINRVKYFFDNNLIKNSLKPQALNSAIALDKVDVVKYMVNNDVSVTDPVGIATKNESKKVLKFLINQGFLKSSDERAISSAIKTKDPDLVKTLIQNGASVETSHIFSAVEVGNPEILKSLIDTLNPSVDVLSKALFSAYEYTPKRDKSSVAKVLLDRGADCLLAFFS